MTTTRFLRLFGLALAASMFAGCSSDDGGGIPAPTSFILNVIVSDAGSVNSAPAGISNCTAAAGDCTETYAAGTAVILTATETASSVFVNWVGSCNGSTSKTCSFVMTRDREEIAVFKPTAVGGIGDTFGLTTDNRLFSFVRTTPGTITSNAVVSGLTTDDQLVGIDFRPANGLLYGLAKNATSAAGRLYLINKFSAAATLVATLDTNLSGTEFAVDFDPVTDSLRVVSDTGQTLEVTPGSGLTSGGAQAGNVNLTGAAYSNNFTGAANSTLYMLNSTTDQLITLTPPATRTVVGDLGANIQSLNGFDIDPLTETAFIAYTTTTSPQFATVNLSNGAITAPQTLGIATVRGLAVPIPSVPEVFGVKTILDGQGAVTSQTLVKFGPLTPDSITDVGNISGLQASETVVGIDFRPADGKLYALGSLGRLYTLSTSSGAATSVGDLGVALAGNLFGLDFDPVNDVLRVVSTGDQNLRVNPTNGTATADPDLARAVMKPSAVAFTNSQQTPAGTTSMFVIDTGEGRLGTINTNTAEGRFTLVGRLGVAVDDLNGFEIIGRTDTNPDPTITTPDQVALAAFASGTQSVLYQISLTSAGATALGTININEKVVGISARAEANPSQNPNQDLYAITESGRLIAVPRSSPGAALTRNCVIGALLANEKVLALDFRPSTNNLHAITDGGGAGVAKRLVHIDLLTCAVSAALTRNLVAGPGSTYTNATLDGKTVGMDFDAAANVLRVTTDARDHLVVNPDTGVVTTRPAIFDRTVAVAAAAYTNSYAGATSTALYDLNIETGGVIPSMLTQNPPDAGTLHDLGLLFPDARAIVGSEPDTPPPGVGGLDVFGRNNSLVLAVLRYFSDPSETVPESFTRLYRANLTTGELTEIGAGIGGPPAAPPTPQDPDPREGRINLTDIAIRFPPIP